MRTLEIAFSGHPCLLSAASSLHSRPLVLPCSCRMPPSSRIFLSFLFIVLVSESCPNLCNPVDASVHGFSKQEHWSGLPFPSAGDIPGPGFKPRPRALQVNSLVSHLLFSYQLGCYFRGSAVLTQVEQHCYYQITLLF